MQLTHQFTVPASIDRVWPVLLDLERIGPCMPGAAITSFDGQHFTGLVKVKIGPVSLTFDGKGSITEKDEAAHRFGVVASGKDARGAGTAEARISVTLSSPEPGTTRADVVTDMAISGKAAQMGRGMIADVSGKLLAQFVACLSQEFATESAPAASAAAPAVTEPLAPTFVEPAPVPEPVNAVEPGAGLVAEPVSIAEPESTVGAEPYSYAAPAEPVAEAPKSAPSEPAPAPSESAPAPSESAPAPAEPEPTPAEPEPTPAEPEPTPAEPEPTPAEPEPAPTASMPVPAEPVAAPAPRADPKPVDLLEVTGAGKWLKRIGVVVLVVAVVVVVWLLAR